MPCLACFDVDDLELLSRALHAYLQRMTQAGPSNVIRASDEHLDGVNLLQRINAIRQEHSLGAPDVG